MARFTTTQSKVGGATSRLSRFIPAARWATLIGAVAVLLFGTPADALWAIVALGATVVSPPDRLEPRGAVDYRGRTAATV